MSYPFFLKTLELYLAIYLKTTLDQLNNDLQKIHFMQRILSDPILMVSLLKMLKREIKEFISFSTAFNRIRMALRYEEIPLDLIVDPDAFESLKREKGEKYSYNLLSWGILKLYGEKEKIPEPFIFIKYDP